MSCRACSSFQTYLERQQRNKIAGEKAAIVVRSCSKEPIVSPHLLWEPIRAIGAFCFCLQYFHMLMKGCFYEFCLCAEVIYGFSVITFMHFKICAAQFIIRHFLIMPLWNVCMKHERLLVLLDRLLCVGLFKALDYALLSILFILAQFIL